MARFWATVCFSATLLASFAVQALPADEARHLLQRSGIGAAPADIAKLADLTRELHARDASPGIARR